MRFLFYFVMGMGMLASIRMIRKLLVPTRAGIVHLNQF